MGHADLTERAKAVIAELRRTHHRVAKDTLAYLIGGSPALLAETQRRRLDKRATTRAEGNVSKNLRVIGLAPPHGDLREAEVRPFLDLRREVVRLLNAEGT